MSQILINDYLKQLDLIKRASGSQRETIVREAFKDLLKAWGRQHDLIFLAEYPLKTATKTNIAVDGALLHELRMPLGYWEAKDAASLYEAQSDMARKLIQQAVGYAVGFQEVVAENQQKLSNLSAATGDDGTPPAPDTNTAPLMIDVVSGLLDTAARSRDAMMEMARQVDEGLNKRPPAGG
mgnify:CR=1 FL=1